MRTSFRDWFGAMREMYLILQRAYLLHCGSSADSRPEARDDMALMHVVPGKTSRVKSRSIRHPQLHPGVGIGEPAGQHTDDFVRRGIQSYLLADDRSVSREAPLEEAPREHNHMVGSNLVFFRPEAAAHSRLYAQEREQVPRASRTLTTSGSSACSPARSKPS